VKTNKKIFLAPISSSNLYVNYQNTVLLGIDYEAFIKFKYSDKYKNSLMPNRTIRIWGIKNAKFPQYDKTSIGDFVLFYYKGFIIGKAIIYLKDVNQELSEILWGSYTNKIRNNYEYWENLLFLSSFDVIKMDFNVLIHYALYKQNACVRGFNEFSPYGLKKIIEKYSSLESFLDMYLIKNGI
jgi:hypothetical protein